MIITKPKRSTFTKPSTTTPDKFSLIEFFDRYHSRIRQMPKHTEKTVPINDYPANWEEIAHKRKVEENWKCQGCAQSFIERKDLLHVHHDDGRKYNNYRRNLRVLCVKCHSDQPGHGHMKATPDYKRVLSISMMPTTSSSRVAKQNSKEYNGERAQEKPLVAAGRVNKKKRVEKRRPDKKNR